jgi:hypothetical protein
MVSILPCPVGDFQRFDLTQAHQFLLGCLGGECASSPQCVDFHVATYCYEHPTETAFDAVHHLLVKVLSKRQSDARLMFWQLGRLPYSLPLNMAAITRGPRLP